MIKQFDYREFTDLGEITAEKQRKGIKISLVIPALKESATIGSIVSQARKSLMADTDFLNEIIVIDDGEFKDGTYQAAADAGADVYMADEIPDCSGFPHGKGACLWRSMFVSKGDIIICIDGDITNFDSRFVYGTASPLIMFPELSFIKAFYDRPLEHEGAVLKHHGGRVTELVIRPFLAMFCPELACIHQPLAGEYAFRRNIVDDISFYSGYSVDIGLLLFVFRKFGISAIAEVDMGVRHHRNRSLGDLGRMSFGIMQAMFQEFAEKGLISMHFEPAKTMFSVEKAAGFVSSYNDEVRLPLTSSVCRGKL